MNVWDLCKRFYPYVAAIPRLAAASIVLIVLAPLLTAALLWSFKVLIDEVLVAGRQDLLIWFAALYVFAISGRIAVDYASRAVEARAVETIVLALRADLYAHLLSLSPGTLTRETTADLLTRLQGDADRTEYLIFTGPLALVADSVAAIVYIGFLFTLDWRLALIALTALPAIVWVVQQYAPSVRKASKLSRRAESMWMSLAEERLAAVPVVHAFDTEKREAAAFSRRCLRVRSLEVKAVSLQASQSALVETIIAISGLAVLALGTHLIATQSLTVGALIAFIGTVGSLYQPIRALAKSAGRFQSSAAGAQRVASMLDLRSRVMEKSGAQSVPFVRGGIEFQDVHFGYRPDAPALRGLSLKIAPGEMVAIVGLSGSGKTSLIRLLLRQYDVDAGAVLIDGQDIRTWRFNSLRAAIAPVFQDPFVLTGTIAKNIRYGRSSATIESVRRVAAASAVDTFAEQRGGLGTPVGHQGGQLSGGQRQRVALARALLRDAPILVLDEATAGVDSETEEKIQAAIEHLAGQRTIIIVAHRLSSVRNADRVVVIENGRVVEQGVPADLLARASRCREIFSAQLTNREAAE